MAPGKLYFSGIHGKSGRYLRSPFTLAARSLPRLPATPDQQVEAPVPEVDRGDLAQAGWGVVFPAAAADGREEALTPLLRHRAGQAGDRYRRLTYRPGTDVVKFLADSGLYFGPVDPERIPYYLLLVGNPEEIPFAVQCQLGVQFAVGRLCFGPGCGEGGAPYERYADNVLRAESAAAVPPPRRAAFFGPEHPGDPLTALCARHLVTGLGQSVDAALARLAATAGAWSLEAIRGRDATKERLTELLATDEAPALLFTVGHGVWYDPEEPEQRRGQGALVCHDWRGPAAAEEVPVEEHSFGGDDLPSDACLSGRVTFHVACFSAGTPVREELVDRETGRRRQLARDDFVAYLPQRLLSHRHGALAVIGHIGSAMLHSFLHPSRHPADDAAADEEPPAAGREPAAEAQLQTFTSTLVSLLNGLPVGAAMEYFGQRHAEIAAVLAMLGERTLGEEIEIDPELLALWLANYDARNYVLLGDPAVRLRPRREEEGATGGEQGGGR